MRTSLICLDTGKRSYSSRPAAVTAAFNAAHLPWRKTVFACRVCGDWHFARVVAKAAKEPKEEAMV